MISLSTDTAALSASGRRAPAVGASALAGSQDDLHRDGGFLRRHSGLLAFPAYLALQIAQLLVLHRLVPRFFWLDDAQIQFVPMSWWLGNHFEGGTPPLLDPDQGMSANLTADMQYGVLDVIRWPFLILAGRQSDLAAVATVQAWLAVLVLGSASLFVLLNHRVHGALAVAGALGVATSGFFLWWGSAWSALMWSIAALFWLWAALSSRRRYAPLGVGLATAAVVCSGNPYILPLVPILLIVQLVERWRRSGRGVVRDRWTVATVLAVLAGAALSVPTLVNALDVAEWMWRPHPEFTVASTGGAMNLLDIVVGGTTQLTDKQVPMMSTLLFALPLVALVDWRRALGQPGVLTAGVLWSSSLVMTQFPNFMMGFRYPFRLLAVVQVAFGLFAVLALARARSITRGRLTVAGGLVLVQALLALSRAPVLWKFHVGNAVLVVLAVAATLVLIDPRLAPVRLRGRRSVRPAAALVVVLLALTPLLVQLRIEQHVMVRYERYVLQGEDRDVSVYRPMTNGYDVGTTIQQFRDNAYATDTSLTVYSFDVFSSGDDRGWSHGVLGGNANLPAGLRPGFGSLAVWQKGIQQHLKSDYESGLALDQPGLMQVPRGADRPWIDLLSGRRVLLGATGAVPGPIAEYFDDNWRLLSDQDGWREYERRDPLPGRVSMATDVTAEDAGPNDGVAHLAQPMEAYRVTTGDTGGRLVFRTAYWNGFRATLDGRPVRVASFGDSVLQVDVPAGVTDGRLEIFFEPIGARLLPYCVAVGGLLLLVSLVPVLVPRRRPGRVEERVISG